MVVTDGPQIGRDPPRYTHLEMNTLKDATKQLLSMAASKESDSDKGDGGRVSGVAVGDICAVRKGQPKMVQILYDPVRVVWHFVARRRK